MTRSPKILVIDDEVDMLKSTCKILNSANYETRGLHDSSLIEEQLKSDEFDLILCDLLMPKLNGKQILEYLDRNKIKIPVIIFSAYGTIDRAVDCIKAGAFDFIEKPYEADHLILTVERAIKYSLLFRERNELLDKLEKRNSVGDIIGKSNSMRKIFSLVENISDSATNVLLTGESGTGKELIARLIHQRSNRNSSPFVPVNCGALPENLFEAEIFGYEKGAFTGADKRKIGLLENANKGTFFLDEVGELSHNSQTKLLRVIQERKLRRLGGNDYIDIDVRFISATNRNIDELFTKGQMREDLYYRINVIHIFIPPLRERIEDIAPLVDYFLNKKKANISKEISGIDSDVIKIFENYSWPGNVRELENIIERAIALTQEKIITVNDLPDHLAAKKNKPGDFNHISLKEARSAAIEEIDKQYLNFLLIKHRGNISKISEDTDMTRRNIYHLLRKYNINPDSWRI